MPRVLRFIFLWFWYVLIWPVLSRAKGLIKTIGPRATTIGHHWTGGKGLCNQSDVLDWGCKLPVFNWQACPMRSWIAQCVAVCCSTFLLVDDQWSIDDEGFYFHLQLFTWRAVRISGSPSSKGTFDIFWLWLCTACHRGFKMMRVDTGIPQDSCGTGGRVHY